MLCWICRTRDATTREHRLKQTDAHDLLGDISGADPAFFNDQNNRNKYVQSTRSDFLKPADPNLCEHCNSALTQPYDKAWEELATALKGLPARGGEVIRLNRLVRYNTHKRLLGVHLWLVKKLGCVLVDAGPHTKMTTLWDETIHLSKSLLQGKACPYLYVTLFPPRMLGRQVAAGDTDVDIWIDASTSELRSAVMAYCNRGATWYMVYAREGELGRFRGQLWHPRQHTSRLEVRTI